jgi:eukaryotic-like serine/threonine-protein kinase
MLGPRPSEERWSRLKEAFQGALESAPEQRERFLDQAGLDPPLRREVAALIEAHERAQGFLDPGGIRNPDTSPLADAEPEEEKALVGLRVGAYRLLGLVGSGGMGAVYRAVRDDDEYEKVVAVKIVRQGVDHVGARERLRVERQILARLEHPGIARLLDGGSTEDGRPYFVMEYVEGQRIDAWAEERGLDVRARLELFLAVCSALQYSHQNLVVHRDIKPANILVTPRGVPKLLDFGIAKLLDPAQGGDATATSAAMTPEYASPEQVRGVPISMASDVYSLGVVLFELLTGRRPYSLQRGEVSLSVAICEREPPLPSAAAPERRARTLRGDLDTIVMKALRKEPARRYASAEQLADDIRRHLGGRPVLARRDTLPYRLGKLVRRNKAASAALALLAASLAAGVVGIAAQARVAERERQRAEAERRRAERRFEDVRKLANSLLFEFHDAIRDLPGATPARQLLVKKALEYLDGLALEAGDDVALQQELAAAYEQLGRVQGFGSGANLGDTAGAFASYSKALRIRAAVAALRPGDPAVLYALASTHRFLGNLHSKQGEVEEARRCYGEAARLAQDLGARDPGNAEYHIQHGRALVGLGRETASAGDLAAALPIYERALAVSEQAYRLDPSEHRIGLALAHQAMADGLLTAGQAPRALEHVQEALALYEEVARASPDSASARREVALAHINLSNVLRKMGDHPAALRQARQALGAFERLLAADPSNALARRDVWAAWYRIGISPPSALPPARAVDACRRAVALATRMLAADRVNHWARRDLAWSHRALGHALAAAGQPQGALRSQRESLALARALAASAQASARDRFEVARSLASTAEAERALGLAREVRSHLEEAVALFDELAGRDRANADLLAERAQAAAQLGRARGR